MIDEIKPKKKFLVTFILPSGDEIVLETMGEDYDEAVHHAKQIFRGKITMGVSLVEEESLIVFKGTVMAGFGKHREIVQFSQRRYDDVNREASPFTSPLVLPEKAPLVLP